MKNIDFLPNSFREQDAQRKTNLWRLGLVAMFGGIIATASLAQFAIHRRVASELAAVEPAYLQAQALTAQLESFHKQRADISQRAQLYTYLMHPWPRTQLLSDIVSPIPEAIVLTNLRLTRERPTKQPSASPALARRARGAETAEDELAKLTPAQRDLKRLRDEQAELRTVVHLTGRTSQIDHLHQYLAQLGHSNLLEKIELISIESLDAANQAGQSQFHVRLTVHDACQARPYDPAAPPSTAQDNSVVANTREGEGTTP